MYCKLVIFSYGLLASFPSFLPLHRAHSCDCHATAARAVVVGAAAGHRGCSPRGMILAVEQK